MVLVDYCLFMSNASQSVVKASKTSQNRPMAIGTLDFYSAILNVSKQHLNSEPREHGRIMHITQPGCRTRPLSSQVCVYVCVGRCQNVNSLKLTANDSLHIPGIPQRVCVRVCALNCTNLQWWQEQQRPPDSRGEQIPVLFLFCFLVHL